MDLTHVLDRDVGVLSGGELQRFAIGVVAVQKVREGRGGEWRGELEAAAESICCSHRWCLCSCPVRRCACDGIVVCRHGTGTGDASGFPHSSAYVFLACCHGHVSCCGGAKPRVTTVLGRTLCGAFVVPDRERLQQSTIRWLNAALGFQFLFFVLLRVKPPQDRMPPPPGPLTRSALLFSYLFTDALVLSAPWPVAVGRVHVRRALVVPGRQAEAQGGGYDPEHPHRR